MIQDVPKSVIQKSAVITSELKVTSWSGTFPKLRLVLKFPFKPPDGIPFVQSCLEILPVIMESYTGAERATVLFVVPRIAVAHFGSEKIQDQLSHKITPQIMVILAW
jgi:hypothetical protein